MAEFLLTQSLSLSHGSRLYSEANRLAFCFAHLHIHGGPRLQRPKPGRSPGQAVPRATAPRRAASQRPGARAETRGGRAGGAGRNSDSARPAASFHPLPSRKDAPAQDFSLPFQRGIASRKLFSGERDRLFGWKEKHIFRAKREDQRVGSCELKTGAFPGGQDLFRSRARHFGASEPVRIKIKK